MLRYVEDRKWVAVVRIGLLRRCSTIHIAYTARDKPLVVVEGSTTGSSSVSMEVIIAKLNVTRKGGVK